MQYIDYIWDLNPDQLILDKDLNTEKLGWQIGDVFKLIDINGRKVFRRVDPLMAFLEGSQINE